MSRSIEDRLNRLGYDEPGNDLLRCITIRRELIKKASEHYEDGDSILTDDEWYSLVTSTNDMERELDLPITSDCSSVDQVDTLKPMYSLNKAYETSRIVKFLDKFELDDVVHIEPKLDGVSMVVCYRNSSFSHIQLKNRTINAVQALKLPIANIEAILRMTTQLPSVDFRGEVVIDLDTYGDYASRYNNARTMVAAMLNSSKLEALDYPAGLFDFIVFESMPYIDIPSCFNRIEPHIETVSGTIDLLDTDGLGDIMRDDLNYLLDGMVFKLPEYNHLGYTAKFPRNHIALKFLSEVIAAKIIKIHIDDTPKGIRKSVRLMIEPTGVEGILVRSINIGSVNMLKLFDLNEGDYVKFRLAGGIVPVAVGKAET